MNARRFGRAVVLRLRADLSLSDRGVEYAALLRAARDGGYRILSLAELWDLTTQDSDLTDQRYLAIRHDVDRRDVAGNRMFRQIERAHGAHATYYFRLWTAPSHRKLIRDLLTEGFEVGYHFEEAATVAKQRRLRDRDAVFAHRDEITDQFQRNCRTFRRNWNSGLQSASSHGEWINRRLGFSNFELLDDDLLADCALDFEAYQQRVMQRAEIYVSDVVPWVDGYGLADALRDERSRIYLLTHEYRWHGNPRAAVEHDLNRLVDEARYRFGSSVA
jgi:hypothetical protein